MNLTLSQAAVAIFFKPSHICHYISSTLSSVYFSFNCTIETLADYQAALTERALAVCLIDRFESEIHLLSTTGASRWKRWNWPSRSYGINGKLLDHHLLLSLNYQYWNHRTHKRVLSVTAIQKETKRDWLRCMKHPIITSKTCIEGVISSSIKGPFYLQVCFTTLSSHTSPGAISRQPQQFSNQFHKTYTVLSEKDQTNSQWYSHTEKNCRGIRKF